MLRMNELLIAHVLLDEGSAREFPFLRRDLRAGDCVVVAPGKTLSGAYDAVLERQLVDRTDAHAELLSLISRLKALAPDPAFQRKADAAAENIYSVLCQGMSLSFRDNGLTDYLHALFVQLCGQCLGAALGAQTVLDGREVILCESNNGIPLIDRPLTEKRISELKGRASLTVVSGSFGRKVTGETVNLGTGGSELTASILAAVLQARAIRHYVSGFAYAESAALTYEEAAQRFSSGEPVYPPAMLPARKAAIPVEVAGLDTEGKLLLTIGPAPEGRAPEGITGVVRSGAMTLLTVYGSGLLGSVGISSALFGILAKEGINIHFISQSVAEYSISFAVKRPDTEQAKRALDALISNTFRSSFTDLSYTSVPVEIVSVFGQGMRHVPGISGRVYSALGAAGVNVVASSQGGEELSISVVVGEADAQKAKEALERL